MSEMNTSGIVITKREQVPAPPHTPVTVGTTSASTVFRMGVWLYVTCVQPVGGRV